MNATLLLSQVIPAILEVGAFIKTEFSSFLRKQAEIKGKNDLVSYVDRTAEEMLQTRLEELTPNCGFINEESGSRNINHDLIWIIDPLDGTTNFVYGVPIFSVSVGLQVAGTLTIGIVYEINRDELFTATAGGGAYLNGSKITVSQPDNLRDTLIGTGFPFRYFDNAENYLQMLWQIMQSTRGLRRLGSAAVDLAYVAAGRFDGFFETYLNPWDVAGGALLVREAGGTVTDYFSGNNYLTGGSIIATNGKIHQQLASIIHRFASKPNF